MRSVSYTSTKSLPLTPATLVSGLKGKFLKRALQVAAGQLAQQTLFFLRNVFVARLLPPQEFGIALTLMTVLSAVDALSELGIEIYLVRSDSVDDPSLQETLHAVLLLKAVLSSIVVFVAADFLAHLFKVPESVSSYQLLALLPILRGLVHLDVKRFERKMKFWPGIISYTGASLIGLLVAVAMAAHVENHTVMLFSYAAQYLSLLILSHAAADRIYKLKLHRAYLRGIFSFGAPLLLNGLLLFVIGQGDRALVASSFGVSELAAYGTAAIVTSGLTGVVMRSAGQLYIPLLSGLRADDPEFLRRYELCGSISTVTAIFCIALAVVAGHHVVLLLFGEPYATSSDILVWLGLQSAVRIVRSWMQVAQLCLGNSRAVLFGNIVSSLSLLIAIATVYSGMGLVAVAFSYAVGELISLLYFVATSDLRKSIEVRLSAITLFLSLVAVAAVEYGVQDFDMERNFLVATGIIIVGFASVVVSSHYLRHLFANVVRQRPW